MELIERIDIRPILWLSSITYTDFSKDCINDNSKTKESDIQTWFTILQQFCKTNIKTRGITTRIYSYSANSPLGFGGRLFSGSSLQGIWGKYRGLLMRNKCTDIDMSNAHPVILRYICRMHNIDCPHLEYYINNRNECLAQFESGKLGKIYYLKATNHDVQNRTVGLPSEFRKYDSEMKRIQKKLVNISKYCEIVDSIPYTKTYNYNGSVINRILCYYENMILQHVIHIINTRGIEIAILMFDGLMIYGNYYNDSKLLNDITTYVENQMPGLNMQWTYKEHNMELVVPNDFIEKHEYTERLVDDIPIFVCNDLDAATILYKLYPYWKYSGGELYVFEDNTGMWKNDKNTHNLITSRFTHKLWTGVKCKNSEIMEASKVKSYGNTTVLFTQMIEKLKTLCIDEYWIKNTYSSSLGKLLFNNGYLDMRTNTFYNKFNPSLFFAGKINHDYEPTLFDESDNTYMESIKQRLFYDPLGKDVGDFLILNLARGLAGDIMKRILFGLGYSNTGKSTITKALIKSCGDYIGTFDGNNFAYRNTSSDSASQNRWLMLLKDKRLIFSNEIKSTISLNGNLIKVVSSGGDCVVGRSHGGNETDFYLSFLCVVFANDLPKIMPYDDAVNNRVRVVSYTKPYVENPTEFELKLDTNIDNEFDTLRFQKCFLEIFIRQYWKGRGGEFKNEPTEMIQAKEDWIGSEIGCIPAFLRDYEITNDETQYIKSNQIQEWIERGKFGITMKKFGMELKQYAITKKLNNVKSFQKKINGKLVQVWAGLKYIDNIIETDIC